MIRPSVIANIMLYEKEFAVITFCVAEEHCASLLLVEVRDLDTTVPVSSSFTTSTNAENGSSLYLSRDVQCT